MPSSSRSASRSSEVCLSLTVFTLGVGSALITASLPTAGGHSGIGPNFTPALVSIGLIVVGAWLLYEAWTGGWRRAPVHAERFQRPPFLWVSAGLFAHMALIGWAGFVVAGTALFALVARGFGSLRLARDLVIGAVLSIAIYLFFTQVLNVGLPAGWMPFPR